MKQTITTVVHTFRHRTRLWWACVAPVLVSEVIYLAAAIANVVDYVRGDAGLGGILSMFGLAIFLPAMAVFVRWMDRGSCIPIIPGSISARRAPSAPSADLATTSGKD